LTTIAYRDGVLAADSLVTTNTHRDGIVVKITKRGPFLAAACGSWPTCLRFLDWFRAGMPIERAPDMSGGDDDKRGACGHIFMPDHLVLTASASGWSRRRAEYYATGTGADYAYGAMAMGASAEDAVRAALKFDTTSGGNVVTLRH
jgi:ATP-dependent HslUV protease subunit HslV